MIEEQLKEVKVAKERAEKERDEHQMSASRKAGELQVRDSQSSKCVVSSGAEYSLAIGV